MPKPGTGPLPTWQPIQDTVVARTARRRCRANSAPQTRWAAGWGAGRCLHSPTVP